MFVVTQERHCDLLFLRPRFLRKRIVPANSINGRQFQNSSIKRSETALDLAHFRGAVTVKRHRKAKQAMCFFFRNSSLKPDLFRRQRFFVDKGEVWRLSVQRQVA